MCNPGFPVVVRFFYVIKNWWGGVSRHGNISGRSRHLFVY
jgi:hypothetical protein